MYNYNTTQKQQDVNNSKKDGLKPDFLALVDQILSSLPQRTKDIFKRRYGLLSEKAETLEKIGHDYGITRERVRQIVSDALKTIKTNLANANYISAEKALLFTIEKNSGIIRESEVLENFRTEANAVKFLAECSAKIFEIEKKGLIAKSWTVSVGLEEKAIKVAHEAEEILKVLKTTLTDDEMAKKLEDIFPEFTKNQLMNYLSVAVRVRKNKFGKWGIYSWPEINPKGTREKVYLILKESKKPLHFVEIADLIDKYNLGNKKAHPQTVHNELIKDDRFVLIGRGMYALGEWGYKEGTIKDVLMEIIGKSNRPMKREEILKEVLKRRKVKKSTILINLNNRGIFERTNEVYTLKK